MKVVNMKGYHEIKSPVADKLHLLREDLRGCRKYSVCIEYFDHDLLDLLKVIKYEFARSLDHIYFKFDTDFKEEMI